MNRLPIGCGYQGYEFGARNLPDSICCGGKLYEIDDFDGERGFACGTELIPCPVCREQDAISYWSDQLVVAGEELANAKETARNLVAYTRQISESERDKFKQVIP
jgi:Zn ribbon nucleic-acid-binding protein